jgi:hypothetical protein
MIDFELIVEVNSHTKWSGKLFALCVATAITRTINRDEWKMIL